MCGIFGYVGKKNDAPTRILTGNKAIEYRGYDSIGIAFIVEGEIKVFKKAHCEAADIYKLLLESKMLSSNIGIGHNRWSTVGKKTDANAHPHGDYTGEFYIVHNGNVDNHHILRKEYSFPNEMILRSETDTELIANMISLEYNGDMEETLQTVMSKIAGSNVILVMTNKDPGKLFGIKRGGTLQVYKNEDGVMISSDANAFFAVNGYNDLHYATLEDNEVLVADQDNYRFKKEGLIIRKNLIKLEDIDLFTNLNGYDHYMEKEIFEQPAVVENVISGRMLLNEGLSKLGGIENQKDELAKVDTFHFIGCGTAYNACYYAKLLFNRFGIKAEAWIASEFCDCHPVIGKNDAFIFISQSGETADTIEAFKEAKELKHKLCLGIVNKQDTEIARRTDDGIHIRAGIEVGVASTKAYIAMLVSVVLFAIYVARQRQMTKDTATRIISELEKMPKMIEQVLAKKAEIKELAKKYSSYKNSYFLGRYFSSVTAMEGSLKLKEISYLHAEGYPLGEMKHGPLAMVRENFASFVIIPNDSTFLKGVMNISEIHACNGIILAISTDDVDHVDKATDLITVPKTLDYLQPILTTIPTQLLAYYTAVELGNNPDKPDNLAKSVTVG